MNLNGLKTFKISSKIHTSLREMYATIYMAFEYNKIITSLLKLYSVINTRICFSYLSMLLYSGICKNLKRNSCLSTLKLSIYFIPLLQNFLQEHSQFTKRTESQLSILNMYVLILLLYMNNIYESKCSKYSIRM